MMNFKPISELRNYNKVLNEVKPDMPVFLTKNGYGKYAVVDLEKYESFKIGIKIYEDVKHSENTERVSFADIKKEFLE